MSIFGEYAKYYDLLYQDKDYAGEAKYVDGLLQQYMPGAKTILELGCGTGHHAAFLAKNGYRIHGIDSSDSMIESARRRFDSGCNDGSGTFTCSIGDIRTVRQDGKFDAAISLFDVMSYQTDDSDVTAVLSTARGHLVKNGIVLFNCWYGPAVLSEKPSLRIKRVANAAIEIVRIAEPVIFPGDNYVNVNYQLFIRDQATGTIGETKECHRMRYFFLTEMKRFIEKAGFDLCAVYAWMTRDRPSLQNWCVCFIGKHT